MRRKIENSRHSLKDLSIEDFDLFVRCVQSAIVLCACIYKNDIKMLYANRIEREFKLNVDESARNWLTTTIEDPLKQIKSPSGWQNLLAEDIVRMYRPWLIYSLLRFYFIGDESGLNVLYYYVKLEALKADTTYKKYPQCRKWREDAYGEKYSVATYIRQAFKEALSEESGRGLLWRAPIYRLKKKNLGKKWIKSVDFNGNPKWICKENIVHEIKLWSKGLLGTAFYRCLGNSNHKARKALENLDAKIDAFLEKKENERKAKLSV